MSIHPDQVWNEINPREALGAGVDGHERGECARIFTDKNIQAMRGAGLRPLTYRLRTELAGEAWHWNPRGTWSDAAHQRGYWISDSELREPIFVSYGFRLPRRGNTIDQANNDGYSRITDGDASTYWKSNPYLDTFWQTNGHTSPQWVVIDLGSPQPVTVLRILWAHPYATSYQIEYWTGKDAMHLHPDNTDEWRAYPHGRIDSNSAEENVIELGAGDIRPRFLRLWALRSSHTAVDSGNDPRDRAGFAIREIDAGTRDADGVFHDFLTHGAAREKQSTVYVSSTDPWHRAEDIDYRTEQPGLDMILSSQLASGSRTLIPVGLLYDSPDNAAAEVVYVTARDYKLEGIELGEEPDGQWLTPEDYGTLYAITAARLRHIRPDVSLGGPSLQAFDTALVTWPDERGERSWMRRCLTNINARDESLQFLSFEFYPFDDVCANPAAHLMETSHKLGAVLDSFATDGVPNNVPRFMTEYGYSVFAGRPEVDVEGALFQADAIGTFFCHGGAKAYLYGYEPGAVVNELGCSWGNLMMLQFGEIKTLLRLATFHCSQLLTTKWLPGQHAALVSTEAEATVTSPAGVTAYSALLPQNVLSVLLVNHDPQQPVSVRLKVDRRKLAPRLQRTSFSHAQYRWHDDGIRGRPIRSSPADTCLIRRTSEYRLDPCSVTVLRGPLE